MYALICHLVIFLRERESPYVVVSPYSPHCEAKSYAATERQQMPYSRSAGWLIAYFQDIDDSPDHSFQ